MELIDNTPPCMYFTWNNDIDEYLDREGKEGELFDRITCVCNNYGRKMSDILDDINNAYRNCTEIYLRKHPEYTYDCSCTNPNYQPVPFEKNFYEQAITYVLLSCQSEKMKSDRIKRLIEKLNSSLWSDDNIDDFDQDLLSIFNNNYFADTDIDFSPHPDIIAIRKYVGEVPDLSKLTNNFDYKKVEFLINLMRTKEEKLMLLDAIDQSYKASKVKQPDASDDLPF